MSTDAAWEEWGRRDPYFSNITDPKFRRAGLDESARREFFESGAAHVHHVLGTIRAHLDPQFVPHRVLEYGCGVGRLLVPFAGLVDEVVGLDVSASMLQEAARNCEERQLRNVRLVPADDELSALEGSFDLIHSCLVFQHVAVERGRDIFRRLLAHIRPGGIAALQVTYAKTRFAETYGCPPPPGPPARSQAPARPPAAADPEMQMNPYNLNELLFLMQQHGARRFYTEFTDHTGELGVFIFFDTAAAVPPDSGPPQP